MIQINKNHLDKFKYFTNSYNYNVKPGIWLSFDKNDLSYIGVEMFYLAPLETLKECDSKLNELISKGILEVID